LKRTLRQREIRIEELGRFIGLTSTVSLEPDPIPLDVKVVLFGDRLLYYLLAAFDPDIAEHFKVLADHRSHAHDGSSACGHDRGSDATPWSQAR
jgi:predicted ATP-dependent protease